MPQNGATDRAVGNLKVYPVPLCVLRVPCGEDFLSLDAAFRAHLFLTFFQRRDSESVPAAPAAYSDVRRVQGAWPLSRLLVLDIARAAVAISASVETESRARIRREIWVEDPGRDRNLLWRDGRGDEEPFRPHLFHRIRPSARGAGDAQIRARRACPNFLRRQPRDHARGARIVDRTSAVLAGRGLLRLGWPAGRSAAPLGGTGNDSEPSVPARDPARRRARTDGTGRDSFGRRREGLCGVEVSAAVSGSEVRHHAHHAAGIVNAAGDPAKAAEKLRFRISGFVSSPL